MLLNSLITSSSYCLHPWKQTRVKGKIVMSQQAACGELPSQDSKQRHFVLVHGACHGAWCWYKVSTLLKSSGHNVTALDMAASGIHPKQVHELHSFSDYFEPLMEFMASLPQEAKVIIVGHSSGGLCISVAMESFPDKISAGVFIAANMPGPDFSHKTMAKKYDQKRVSTMDTRYIYGNGPKNPPTAVLLGRNYISSKYYRSSPLEDFELATKLLRPTPLLGTSAIQDEVLLTKEKYGSVRRVFILCDQDDNEMHRWTIENNPPDEVKVISGADHMVMFSKPEALCCCLQEIGDKYS